MKIGFIDDYELVVIDNDRAVPIEDLLPDRPAAAQERLVQLIDHFDQLRPAIESAVTERAGKALAEVRLRPPAPRPPQFLCAMVNYRDTPAPGAQVAPYDTTEAADFFLKSSLSIIGHGDVVELPDVEARVFHYEPELGVVVGRAGYQVPAADAGAHIFGYTIIIDASARGVGNAFYKHKSQRTFGPVGPWIVTADEFDDPHQLQIRLSVNDEIRQDFNTDTMLHPIAALVEVAAATAGIEVGDLIATGTHHEGLGPIQDGDEVAVDIEGIGRLAVTTRDARHRSW